MKLLLLGSTGQIGSAILRLAPEDWHVTAWSRADVDMTDTAAVRKKLNAYGREGGAPDYIVNAAAYTKVDLADSNPTEATKLNLDLPEVLAEAAQTWGAKLVHFSTDYVYPGTGAQPHRESDETGPLNIYGKTKLFGDQAVMASGCEYLIFRTSWVYAATGKNFLLTMMGLARDKEALRIVADQYGSPSFADDIAGATIDAMKMAVQMPIFPSGVYHLTNSGFTNWHEFAEAILAEAKKLGWPVVTSKITPVESKDYPTPAKRPLNSRLDLQKIETVFAIRPRPWQDAMKDVVMSVVKRTTQR